MRTLKLQKQVVLPSFVGITCSGLIGILVALPFIIHKPDVAQGVLKSFIIGVVIAVCGTFAFSFALRNVRRRTIRAFLWLAIVIATGTIGGALLFGFKAFYPLFMMTVLAEITGLILTFAMYRYSTRLNEQLIRAQDRYKKM